MPRLARNYLESPYCHIIVQGIDRQYIFKETNLKNAYKNILKKKIIETDIQVLAYCIMDNHAHILLHVNEINELTKLMQKINTSYAKLYNKMKNRVGYVFRDRYYAQSIITEEQLYNCIVYIHNNPIKANMIKNLGDYIYSSYKEYKGKKYLITEKSIELAFGSIENYNKVFDQIHDNKNIENIIDVQDKFIESKQIIEQYTRSKNISISDIVTNDEQFCDLLLQLRHYGGLSLRKMAELFNCSKDKINNIINKKL